MNLLSIAWKSIRWRALASALTALSVALGVALMVTVLVINGVIGEMFSQSGSGYDLIVGPKGSNLQLVLSTIYRVSPPIENLPYRFYNELTEHPSVEQAIPIALGDETEEGGFPIVGTLPELFSLEYVRGKRFQVKGDFLQDPWDAVIGSEVARVNGWGLGDTFRMVHGGQDDHVHDEEFTVRGVLAPTGTPNDRSVFVSLGGFFLISGHEKPLDEAIEREAAFFGEDIEDVRERYRDVIEEEKRFQESEGHHHHAAVPDAQKEITSVLLIMKGENELQRAMRARMFQSQMKEGFQAQAVNPVIVMSRLMKNLVGNVRLALLWMTGLIILVSGIGIFVSIYNSMNDRRREIGIMRALGARRNSVFAVILLESLLLCVGGGVLGIILGHGLVYIAAPIVQARSGLLINPTAFEPVELYLFPALILLATLIGFLPGLTAYRTDVADALAD